MNFSGLIIETIMEMSPRQILTNGKEDPDLKYD